MKRLAIVGAGARGYFMFALYLKEKFSDKIEIVAVCDPNPTRSEYFKKTINPNLRVYTDFDRMLCEVKPDAVLVTTVDAHHHEYIIRSLEAGVEVFSEKPMTIDEEKCRAIRDAERRTGGRVKITFNCRFMPYFVHLKELLDSGVIGKPLAIHYEYLLHPTHGGAYFQRWHRHMNKSGGMLVHKATHHFDIVNWLLGDEPVRVSAQGQRLMFGLDDRPHGERCYGCPHAKSCPNFEDLSRDEARKTMYIDAYDVDGYAGDHCPYAPDTDIYDTMSVSVSYQKGTLLTYSLTLYSTDEGYNFNVIGEKGRIEASTFFGDADHDEITVRYRDGRVDRLTYPKAGGMHAGGDERMLAMLFGDLTDDPLGQCADSFDGIKSAMIGICANESIRTGKTIDLTEKLEEMR